MPQKFKAAIFDLDGVIVDTAKFHYEAWKNIAHKLGYFLTLEQNELLKGVSRIDSMEIVANLSGKTISEQEKSNLAAEKNDRYIQLVDTLKPDDILPGVYKLLRVLKEKNIKIVLGSASKNAAAVVKKLGIENIFDAIADAAKIKNPKPDPEIFLKCAELCGMHAHECVVFEDSSAGITAAKAGGMYAVGIGSPSILKQADLVIPDTLNLQCDVVRNLFT